MSSFSVGQINTMAIVLLLFAKTLLHKKGQQQRLAENKMSCEHQTFSCYCILQKCLRGFNVYFSFNEKKALL
ncbi:hypothetical protein BX070DRAFT_225617 [Coemansia spiralis]|nr:hypothetical protein BX070DRAFT_225617 [Coemansia spiralis]